MITDKIKRVYREIPYRLNTDTVPPPQTIFLVINSVCNLHCKMCDIGMQNKNTHFYKNMNTGNDLPYDVIEKLIDEVRKFNPLIAIISTEPLLYKGIEKVVALIRKNGLKCQLTTNGLILPDYAEKLIDADLDVLYVSLDGPKETHNMIRGNKNAWDNAINGMELIAYMKEEKKKKCPRVRVNYTISGYNYDKLMDFLESTHLPDEDEYPVGITRYFGHVDFSHLNMVTKTMAALHNAKYPNLPCTESSVEDEQSVKVDVDVLWDQIQSVKSTYSSGFASFSPDIKTKKDLYTFYHNPHQFIEPWSSCKVPWNAAQIFSNGMVGVATRCYNVNFGNIKNQRFFDIWNGDSMRKFRKELREKGAYPACTRCCGLF